MSERKDKSMSGLTENSHDITSSISEEELVEMGKLFEGYLEKSGVKKDETFTTIRSDFFDYLQSINNEATIGNESLLNQPTVSNNENIKKIEDKWIEYFKSISTQSNSELTNEELVKKILESQYGFSFNSGRSDSWKDYEELDSAPEKIGKLR
ncbi:MAG: hypothetical protein K2I72_01400 [Bacilli bacterium]|nr:hypothetical protein [Bacilli bacterium]